MQVKFCGLTQAADIAHASEAGATAIGLVMIKKSPRWVNPEQAASLAALARQAGLQVVALFVDQPVAEVQQAIDQVKPDVLQFHGQESAAYCDQFEMTYWKAVPMLADADWQQYIAAYPRASAYLLDSFGGQQMGGSGKQFDWFQFPQDRLDQMILAGGLKASNVASAIQATGARFVDTSSGIESAPGVKSKEKMQAFMAAIHTTNNKINA